MIGVGIDLFRYGGGGGAEPTSLFNVVTYTGDGADRNIDVGFEADFVWIKERNGTQAHRLYDRVRGNGAVLFSNLTNAEVNTVNDGIHFDYANGFNIDVGINVGSYNGLGDPYVAWCWKAGGTAVTNTDGSITSQVSANVDAGFSIVSYTATNSSSNVGHGLGQAPELIIFKSRTSASSWPVYTTAVDGTYDYLGLNLTSAKGNSVLAAPSSSVVYVNHTEFAGTNVGSNNYIAYAFHSVEGLSKIGTYSGTGSDQAITGLGFQPDFVLIKRTDSTGDWRIVDSARLTSGESNFLYPNLNNIESISAVITMESDGFSMDGGGAGYNASGGTYLYMAIKGQA